MAERIPRAIVPIQPGIELPTLPQVKVNKPEVVTVGRFDNIKVPVTRQLDKPVVRTAKPPVTSSLRGPVLNTPELDIIQYGY